ncbi:MAG TPA: hypothetical protein VIJ20_00925 [Solirubrobacteraceae bacterium]
MRRLRLPVGATAIALVLGVPALAHANQALCGLPLLPACPVPVTTTTTRPPPVTTPSPAAPAPLVDAGAQYAGRNSFHWYDVITVAKDGQRLSAFDLGFQHGSCSNHQPYYSEFGSSVKHGAAIDSAGRVSYSTGFYSHATFLTTRGNVIKGREEIAFTIHFTAGRLSGTLRDTFISAKLRCSSGPVSFAAYPFGTTQAPLHDATAGTGRYAGESSENSRVALQVFLPLRWVHSFRITWRAYCRNGYSFRSTSTLDLLFITRSRFSTYSAGLVPADRKGLYERFRMRLTGKFLVQSPNYSVEGTWKWSDAIYRAGRRLGSCTTGPVTFSATGPRAPLPAG